CFKQICKQVENNIFEVKSLGLKQLKASYIKLLAQIQTNVFSKLASLEQPLFNDWLRGWEVGCALEVDGEGSKHHSAELRHELQLFLIYFFLAEFFVSLGATEC